jgi:hypothetical protein
MKLKIMSFSFIFLSFLLFTEIHSAKVPCSAKKEPPIPEAFVTFATENYFSLLEVTIKSIHAFSIRPIIAYGINADIPFDTNKYPRLIKRRIDEHAGLNIYFQKFNIIIQSNVTYGIYIESDDIANYRVDDLFKQCRKIKAYPLCPIHPLDPQNQQQFMNLLGVKKKTNPYVHGHILFSAKCIPFLEECLNAARTMGTNMGANWDETILNVMLWKHGVHDFYLPIFDPYYVLYEDYLHDICPKGCFGVIDYHLIHGCKDASVANAILEILKQNKGKPIRVYDKDLIPDKKYTLNKSAIT